MRLNELGQFFTKVIVFNSILNAPKHPQTKQLQPKITNMQTCQNTLRVGSFYITAASF